MALFHVARYAGPEASRLRDAEVEAGSRARVLLERLQNRARERQQQEPKPEPAGEAEEAAGRRRRRPRRRHGGSVAQCPEAPRAKRQKADYSVDAGGPCGRDVDGVVEASSCVRCGVDIPLLLCRAGRGEESPGELNTDLEDSGEKPPEEAPRPPAPGPVLGDFARRKTPKVSESGRPPATLQPYRGGGGGVVFLWVLFLPLCGPNYRMAGGL